MATIDTLHLKEEPIYRWPSLPISKKEWLVLIVLNGEPKELPVSMSLQQLLEQLSLPAGRVACEVNLKIIKRAFYPETFLKEGDTVEIIQAIGGG